MGGNTVVGRGVRGVGRAIDPSTGRGLANLATGGMYEMNRQAGVLGGAGGKNQPPDLAGAVNEQTRANRPTQNGPFGSTSWTQDENGNWTQNTSLTPGLQDAAQSITGGLANQLDPSASRDAAIQAAYSQATSRLDPQWQQREAQSRTSLLNQGLSESDAAYKAQTDQLGQQRNDAYAQAMYNAQTGAGNAAFGQSLAANMQPYQQLQSLQNLSRPNSFMGAGSTADALANQYGIEQAGKNSKMSGAAGLGGAALAASDERLKDRIERHGVEVLPGVELASWEWKCDPGTRRWGVIAQDVAKVRPDLVVEHPAGFLMVNYGGM